MRKRTALTCRRSPSVVLTLAILAEYFLGSFADSQSRIETAPNVVNLPAVQRVLSRHCVVCHDRQQHHGGLNLEPDSAFRSVVKVKSVESALMLVSPGNPEISYLYLKITGRHNEGGGSGETMPVGNPMLASEEIQLIRDWIATGAAR